MRARAAVVHSSGRVVMTLPFPAPDCEDGVRAGRAVRAARLTSGGGAAHRHHQEGKNRYCIASCAIATGFQRPGRRSVFRGQCAG